MEYNNNNSSMAKIRIVGVGGAGGNAINDMMEINNEITGVEFIAINTDKQDLERSLTPNRVMLGKGMGAGADPEKGRVAAKESEEKIKEVLQGTDMLFITAGMGGGTGTGAAPVVAEIAKEMGILTVGVVTKPFDFEGPLKKNNAEIGIENLKKHVDTLIVIPNQKLFDLPNVSITLLNAFKEANGVLKIGTKGISDLITKQGHINLDFADVKAVIQNSGIAMLGFGESSGDERARNATEMALNSPLLEKSIQGARKILLNITAGNDIGLHEVHEIANTVSKKTENPTVGLIWGVILDPTLENTVQVSLIATDFIDTEYGNETPTGNGNSFNDGKLHSSNGSGTKSKFIVPSIDEF